MTDFQSEQLDYDRSGSQAQKYADFTTEPPLNITQSIFFFSFFYLIVCTSDFYLKKKIFSFKFYFIQLHRDLGKSISHVELNVPKLTAEEIIEVEEKCNNVIRQAKPVQVQYLSKTEAMDLEEVR